MPAWSVNRQFARYRIQLPLLYKPTDAPGSAIGVGWTRDLGEGGACLELPEGLPPGLPLRLRLQTGQGPIDATAQVAWVGATVLPSGGTLHGAAFAKLAPEQLQPLRELLISHGEVRDAGVRLPFDVPVSCQRKARPGPTLQGRTGNISRGGVLLCLPEALPPGAELELSLHPATGPVAAAGRIVWVAPPNRRGPGGPIPHGLQFTALGWTTMLSLGITLVAPM